MSDVMRIQPFAAQLRHVLVEHERRHEIFGVPAGLFYVPRASLGVPDLFGKKLATPVGPSAGPHTQLSQNIVASWLCGGRFIELKTVQVRDDLVIPRPCIDMTDEGYNVEWSQELRLDQSAHEYIVAWALIHLLPRILGWPEEGRGPGTVFDMSVGYDLAGIQDARMTAFMDTLANASAPLAAIRDVIGREFPHLADVEIPDAVANSVTLSTMHGCPPDEIERIARYCLEQRRLHTVVKLNPTLLGRDAVLDILHRRLGFEEIRIPEAVFDHDLQYDRAVELIRRLQLVAARLGLTFGVKLSNTLAMGNHAGRLPGDEMYMSGRALFPVTMQLHERLLRELDGNLHVSYSAGADAVNVPDILACGALPVTGCTDLLKPGGVARMTQWLDALTAAMAERGVSSLAEWSRDRLGSVKATASDALRSPRYRKDAFPHGLPKVASALGLWDCVTAPCEDACAVAQDVPEYAWLVAQGRHDEALATVLARNPLPGVTGYVCTHLCQARCTRNDYEESVAIRALKRVAEERGKAGHLPHHPASRGAGVPPARRVAVVGSGPSGLAASAFLALNGVAVTIFEARDVPGGMMRLVPPFRLPQAIIDRDIDRILELGVDLRLGSRVNEPPEALLRQGFDAVYLASGFQRDTPLRIPGVEGFGVIPALDLLDRSRRGERVDLGSRVAVIGGGDTAMDAARTARRFCAGPVTLLYRRTRQEMPAAPEEVEGALEEGVLLEELVAPAAVLREDGRVVGVRCLRTRLGQPGPDGRRSPEPIAGSEFTLACDSVVVAIGQLPDLTFLDGSRVARHERGGVLVDEATRCAGPEGVFAGGDVVIEPGSIISACADGRAAAEAVCARLGIEFRQSPAPRVRLTEAEIAEVKRVRARRIPQWRPPARPTGERAGFALIEATLTEEDARAEARRCVQCSTFCDKCVEVCPNRANYTFTMQPVRWTLPILARSNDRVEVVGEEPFEIRQDRQIVHVDDFCNECDNCQTFCVHQGRPYADKPRLFLAEAAFEAERDNAFIVQGTTIRRREAGLDSRLSHAGGSYVYEHGGLRVVLTEDWTLVAVAPADIAVAPASLGAVARRAKAAVPADVPAAVPADAPAFSLRMAAEMAVLLEGITSSLPFLMARGAYRP